MTRRNTAGSREEPGYLIVVEAFRRASQARTECRPVHLLEALAALEGTISEGLRPVRPEPRDNTGGSAGAGSTYVFGQTQGAAADFATTRGEPLDAPHLLVALLDQGDTETKRMLTVAGINIDALRQEALQVLGAPIDFAPITMPPLTPAATLDRPPLDIEDLDPRA